MEEVELKKLKKKVERNDKMTAFKDDKNPKPPLIMWREFLDVSDKLDCIKEALEENEEENEYYEEIQRVVDAIDDLRETFNGKDMSVNIPLDDLAEAVNRVETSIKNIPKTVIPEQISYNEKLENISTILKDIKIPAFPLKEFEAMLMAIGKRLDNIVLPDYEENFDELIKAVKNIKQGNTSITSNGFKNVGLENASSVKINPATEEKQDTANTALAKLIGFSIPAYDYISLSYTGDNLTGVVYKTGGSSGTTVATLTLAYTGSVLNTITKT